MNFDIKISVEKEFENNPKEYVGNRLGSGWVEVDGAFKFPVNILRTKDNRRMFVKYPEIQNGDGEYNNVVFPVDKELREEVENAVMKEFRKLLTKGLNNPQITSVRVTLLPEEIKIGKIAIKGYASINISGFAVNRIQIKEGANGPFVQMPQTKDKHGQYHDICYGTNKIMQTQIINEVLECYEKELKLRENSQSEVLIIDKAECTLVDSWGNNQASYVIGQSIEDNQFYFVRCEMDGRKYEDGYDHLPTREEVENDHAIKVAQMQKKISKTFMVQENTPKM